MDAQIVRLTSEVEKLEAINKLFAEVFEDEANYQSKLPSPEYLAAWLKDEKNIALAAEIDGEVVGGLVAFTLQKFEQERTEIYIYDLAVSTAFQRRGIGRSLVNAVCKLAKQMGSSAVFVQADEGDEAIKFYESLNPLENLKTRSFDLPIG
jgi:aminoglycoside 3-N-acetyltransferase I